MRHVRPIAFPLRHARAPTDRPKHRGSAFVLEQEEVCWPEPGSKIFLEHVQVWFLCSFESCTAMDGFLRTTNDLLLLLFARLLPRLERPALHHWLTVSDGVLDAIL